MTDEPSTLPTPVTPAPLPVVAPQVTLNQAQQQKLAVEVSKNLRDLDIVIKDYGLTDEQYKHLLTLPFYKGALEIAVQEWNSAGSTVQRIKTQAAVLLEANLVQLGARMGKNEEALPAVVETGKLLTKLAGIGEQGVQQNTGEKFSITINLGDDKTLKFEKDVTPTTDLPVTIEVKGDKA